MDIQVIELTGDLITACFVTGLFILSFIFFKKISQARKSGIELSPLFGLALFNLFYGVSSIFFIYWAFFKPDLGISLLSEIFYKAAVLSGYCGIIGLNILAEKMLRKTKYVFTGFTIICTIYSAFFLHTESDLRLLSYITMPIGFSIVLINFIYQLLVKTRGVIRRKMVFALLCILGNLCFYLMGTEIGKGILPWSEDIETIIADIGSLGTLILWGYIFLGLETFTEFGWEGKMKELYIIALNGATLFHYSFEKKPTERVPDLVGAGLSGVKEILAEMIQSKQTLKVVDHQDIKIIFEYGNYSTLALISYENLNIYHSKLASLIIQFENIFQDVLSQWNGEIDIFRPTKHIIEDIFS